MKKLKLLCWAIVAGLAILLGFSIVIDNPEPITVRLLGSESPELPEGLWMLLLFFVGSLFGLLSGWPKILRQKQQLASLKRRVQKLGDKPV